MDNSTSDDSDISAESDVSETLHDNPEDICDEYGFVFKSIDKKRKLFKIKKTCTLSEFIEKFNCITEYCKQDEYDPFFIINSVLYCDLPFPKTVHTDLLKSLNLPVKSLDTPLCQTNIKKGRKFMYHHSVDCKHEFKLSSSNYPLYITMLPMCSVCEMNRPTIVVGKDPEGMYTNALWCKQCFDEFHFGMDMSEVETKEIQWKPL